MLQSRRAFIFLMFILFFSGGVHAVTPTAVKEWTFLIYLNGNNSLDSFGPFNLKQMEKVGSTDKVNIVVQWASLSGHFTKRLYIQKSLDPNNVTSPVVETLNNVDMGDYHSFEDFIEWGAKNYPAQKYFVNIWNHGGGWHLTSLAKLKPTDISWDDNTGHFIKTEELGQSLKRISQVIGQKVDLYGSDACLMGMAEVAGEMADSVKYYVGSQEVEPGEGWSYDTLLTKWNALADSSPANVSKALVESYIEYYKNGPGGNVTMAAYDLSKMSQLEQAIAEFSKNLIQLPLIDRQAAMQVALKSQAFTYVDYVDLVDFVGQLEAAPVKSVDSAVLAKVKTAVASFVMLNGTSASMAGAHGLSIWIPDSTTLSQYESRYSGLVFNQQTNWLAALKGMLQ